MGGQQRKSGVRKLFSTGQIAELVGVKARTVTKWIDSGELQGTRLPGGDLRSGDRRVHREALRSFLQRFEFIWALRELDKEEGIMAVQDEPDDEPEPEPGSPQARKRKRA